MKKIISSILCISLLVSILCVPVSATKDVVASESIEEFCENVNEMVTEYSDSEFVTPDFIEEEQTTENTYEEIEINYCPRLIVQSDEPIDTYKAVDVVSGFSNFWILQFRNEEDTNYAYEHYKNNPDIISVDYDVSCSGLLNDDETTIITGDEAFESFKNSWCHYSTGMDKVLEKYKNVDLPEVKVAIIDTGFDFNNIYFSERIIPTGFNNAGDGDEGSEQDYQGHGTAVSSVVYNYTTDNVKIANYRFLDSKGGSNSLALGASTILKAVNDGADVINCSFHVLDAYELYNAAIEYAYEHECAIFASAGNYSNNIDISFSYPLNNSPKTITVAAHTIHNMPVFCSGKAVDICAPGVNVPVIGLNNIIELGTGTSYASPFMAAVYAMFCSVNPNMSFEDRVRAVKNSGDGLFDDYLDGWYGSGAVNALKLFELDELNAPIFSHNEKKYDGAVPLEIICAEDTEIYYTLDGTYPTKDNGYLYSEPIIFEDEEMRVRAVAYKADKKSNCTTRTMVSTVVGTDDMFTITKDGVITAYNGTVSYLAIPENINGISVIDIKAGAFSNEELKGVVLPDTVKYLGNTDGDFERPIEIDDQLCPFECTPNLKYIWGDGIEYLGYYACMGMSNLSQVFFPNCVEIYPAAFYCSGIIGVNFPNVKKVGAEAFMECNSIRGVYLPVCEEIGYHAFNMQHPNGTGTGDITILYIPKANFLKESDLFGVYENYAADSADATTNIFNGLDRLSYIDLPKLESIGTDAFIRSAVKRVELSSVKYMYNIPNTLKNTGKSCYVNYHCPVSIELSLPSTLQYCVPATDYKNEYIEYVVYGTAGINSYAERWAKENDVEFINISQETAIVEDIEPVWDKYSYKPLEFDARGFNRTYQWYGSNDNIQGNYDDIPIAYATDKTFDPDDQQKTYRYYYCEMLSVDGDSSVTITSSMCENRLYAIFALVDTHIDFENKLIYTTQFTQNDFSSIIGTQNTVTVDSIASCANLSTKLYGTGSMFIVYENSDISEIYTLIVQGDINGDSTVNVIDLAEIERASNGHKALNDSYFLAGDINCNEVIDVSDFQTAVNMALQQ